MNKLNVPETRKFFVSKHISSGCAGENGIDETESGFPIRIQRGRKAPVWMRMGYDAPLPGDPPACSLPIDPSFSSEEVYVDSLLEFVTSCELFHTLCGGVHILDFLTKEINLYSSVFPLTWRDWFDLHSVPDLLDFLMHEDVSVLESFLSAYSDPCLQENIWRAKRLPPKELLVYVLSIRKLALRRDFSDAQKSNHVGERPKETILSKHTAIGMKPKKIHEVQKFVAYVDRLADFISLSTPHAITHIIDFGSGQNYLGRALASPPFEKNVIALESKQLNIDGAKVMDIVAKLTEKQKVIRNKKKFRSNNSAQMSDVSENFEQVISPQAEDRLALDSCPKTTLTQEKQNSIHYIQTIIENGDLSEVLEKMPNKIDWEQSLPQYIVISLHSCGNLLHHGLRSLIMNPTIKAVAMVGCCYNLVTERLGPPSLKPPFLRTSNPRLDRTSTAFDPHGFPMSDRMTHYKHRSGDGIRLNITARMMAVQAPQNWTDSECESFFTRHFYRALLQRIFLDRGLISTPSEKGPSESGEGDESEGSSGSTPIIIGSLRKSCYTSFANYVRGAIQKVSSDPQIGAQMSKVMGDMTDEDMAKYEKKYKGSKKELSIVWSLMAFSATVVEAVMVVDRWLYLREQAEVKDCWVETVFDYKQSPRNLVVVGIKH